MLKLIVTERALLPVAARAGRRQVIKSMSQCRLAGPGIQVIERQLLGAAVVDHELIIGQKISTVMAKVSL